jgi:hypothetical protein
MTICHSKIQAPYGGHLLTLKQTTMNELLNTLQEQFDKMQAEIDRLTHSKMALLLALEKAQAESHDARQTPKEMLGKTAFCNMVHVVAQDNQISEASLWRLLSKSVTCEDLEKLINITKLPPLQHEDNI